MVETVGWLDCRLVRLMVVGLMVVGPMVVGPMVIQIGTRRQPIVPTYRLHLHR